LEEVIDLTHDRLRMTKQQWKARIKFLLKNRKDTALVGKYSARRGGKEVQFTSSMLIDQVLETGATDENALGALHPQTSSIAELQGGSNMTGTNCDLFTHKQSR
jgi:hypothetical protein